jgi:hypothetical protein
LQFGGKCGCGDVGIDVQDKAIRVAPIGLMTGTIS